MLDSASRRKLEEDDFSQVNFVISTTGVIGDPSVHNEPIGVTSVMADSYGHAAHRCGNYGPIRHSTNRCASKLLVTQATPRTVGSAGLRHMAHYGAIMPQYLVSAPAQFQAPSTAAAAATMAATATMAGTAGTATMVPMAPMAGSQAGLYTGAPTVNI